MFGGRVCNIQWVFAWVNCAPLLANMFRYSYEADFIQGLLQKNKQKLPNPYIASSTM